MSIEKPSKSMRVYVILCPYCVSFLLFALHCCANSIIVSKFFKLPQRGHESNLHWLGVLFGQMFYKGKNIDACASFFSELIVILFFILVVRQNRIFLLSLLYCHGLRLRFGRRLERTDYSIFRYLIDTTVHAYVRLLGWSSKPATMPRLHL